MLDVEVIDDSAAAATALDPMRRELLAKMRTPVSAATLAKQVGITRQKVNYHLRELETRGLVREAGRRRWGGLTERLMEASAGSYVVSPLALGPAATDPARHIDRLSAGYLIALAARAVREVGSLYRRAVAAEKSLATLSIDAEIRFRSAAERAQFTQELTTAIHRLAAKYHDAGAAQGRTHRLIVLAHPLPLAAEPDPSSNNKESPPCP